jgi:hypothetical protein
MVLSVVLLILEPPVSVVDSVLALVVFVVEDISFWGIVGDSEDGEERIPVNNNTTASRIANQLLILCADKNFRIGWIGAINRVAAIRNKDEK